MLRRAGESLPAVDPQEETERGDEPAGTIGRFQIIRELGRGGLGVVLLAHDPLLSRNVALKLPRPEAIVTPQLRHRFRREGQAAARLTHPNIVPVYEVGEIGPICYIAAAYVAGETLAHWIARQKTPCSPRLAARIVADLADAMHYAHGQQVLHRDLKPGNVLLQCANGTDANPTDGESAERPTPKITDFGLAKVLDSADNETRDGVMLGTLNYMSPEQARGDLMAVGPSSDIYSLGAILYELLAGHSPYPAATEADALALLLGETEPAPLNRAPLAIPRDLAAICLRCLEKTPARRYASAAALAGDLRRFLAGEPTAARPLSAPQRLARWSRRQPAVAGLMAIVFTALLVIAAGAVWHSRTLNKAFQLAQENANRATRNEQASQQHESRANEQLYAAEIRLADLALRDGDLDRASRLLGHYEPGTRLAALRGMEWHVLSEQLAWMRNEGEQCTTSILPHPTEMYTAQFAPDSKLIYTGGQDGKLRVWDHTGRILVHEVDAHDACLNALRISPDGSRLATGSCDRTLCVWQLSVEEPPRLRHRLEHVEPVRKVVFSPEGSRIACVTSVDFNPDNIDGGTLCVYDVESGTTVHAQPAFVRSLDWSPDGKFLIACGHKVMRVLRTDDWSLYRERQFQNASGFTFTSPAVVTYLEHPSGLFQYRIETDSDTFVIPLVRNGNLAWNPLSQLLGIQEDNAVARLFDLKNANRPISFFPHSRGRIGEVSFSPDGRFLASAGFDKRVCITELTQWFGLPPTVQHTAVIKQGYLPVDFDADGKQVTYLDSVGVTSRVPVDWTRPAGTVATERPVWRSAAAAEPRAAIKAQFAAGARRIEQSEDGKLWLCDLDAQSREPLATRIPQKLEESAVLAGDYAALFYRGRLRIVDLHTAETIHDAHYDDRPAIEGHDLTISEDRRWLAIASNPGGLQLWDLATRTARTLRPSSTREDGVRSPVISRDGRFVAVIEQASKVFVWETATARLIHSLTPTESPGSLAFSPDARTLAVGTNRELQFWHLDTEQCLAGVPLPQPFKLHYSPDGKQLTCMTRLDHAAELFRWTKAD